MMLQMAWGLTYDHCSMVSFLNKVPPEVFIMILKNVPVQDHLNMKLTSKALAAVAKDAMDVASLSREEQIGCHMKLEANAPRQKRYSFLTCFSCGALKSKSEYIDAHQKKKVSRRTCMGCAIRFGRRRKVNINGELSFACRGCKKFVLVSPTSGPQWYYPRNKRYGKWWVCRPCFVSVC